MNLKKMVVLTGLAIGIMAATQIVFAEEAASVPSDSVTISNQQSASPKDGDMQWAWGEVTDLDSQAKTITLKYLDYETDQEKDLVLAVDDKTTFENVKDFSELKLKDTLSIDYVVGADNKNVAKNISLEKPDDSSSVTPAAVENSGAIVPAVNAADSGVDASLAVPAAMSVDTSATTSQPAPAPVPVPAATSAQPAAPAAQAQ
jgi:hypothetical protein